uniref:Uncharacterized protein n=1 Tax=Chromera velia CCMP2878 TaxID=1169474 RepID=A0A0G4HXN0_9ALVE|eukprot:Cvel_33199.t1-p1 / transcript=Cvel_33199.t1 / gene=Cvel_33199 / organism=Chromera_velia_CCMP2878 / gene_product=hypothetical protein / transcript_product=hypothetical protein / location=Cvel_scaffold5330:686-3696(+) / protein_length=753 / sequence_SO=supercontig / SO=protein_coding / is_pseudo=false
MARVMAAAYHRQSLGEQAQLPTAFSARRPPAAMRSSQLSRENISLSTRYNEASRSQISNQLSMKSVSGGSEHGESSSARKSKQSTTRQPCPQRERRGSAPKVPVPPIGLKKVQATSTSAPFTGGPGAASASPFGSQPAAAASAGQTAETPYAMYNVAAQSDLGGDSGGIPVNPNASRRQSVAVSAVGAVRASDTTQPHAMVAPVSPGSPKTPPMYGNAPTEDFLPAPMAAAGQVNHTGRGSPGDTNPMRSEEALKQRAGRTTGHQSPEGAMARVMAAASHRQSLGEQAQLPTAFSARRPPAAMRSSQLSRENISLSTRYKQRAELMELVVEELLKELAKKDKTIHELSNRLAEKSGPEGQSNQDDLGRMRAERNLKEENEALIAENLTLKKIVDSHEEIMAAGKTELLQKVDNMEQRLREAEAEGNFLREQQMKAMQRAGSAKRDTRLSGGLRGVPPVAPCSSATRSRASGLPPRPSPTCRQGSVSVAPPQRVAGRAPPPPPQRAQNPPPRRAPSRASANSTNLLRNIMQRRSDGRKSGWRKTPGDTRTETETETVRETERERETETPPPPPSVPMGRITPRVPPPECTGELADLAPPFRAFRFPKEAPSVFPKGEERNPHKVALRKDGGLVDPTTWRSLLPDGVQHLRRVAEDSSDGTFAIENPLPGQSGCLWIVQPERSEGYEGGEWLRKFSISQLQRMQLFPQKVFFTICPVPWETHLPTLETSNPIVRCEGQPQMEAISEEQEEEEEEA